MDENIIAFKERLEEDSEFKDMFVVADNLDEIIDIAKENGYDLELEEIENDLELSDYLLEAVAGGTVGNSDADPSQIVR